ncbi:MAG: hypothetical protein Q9195_004366 [Heterodermia aff. obscurata]
MAAPNASGGRPHIPGPHNPYPGTGRHDGVPSLPPTDGHSGLSSRAGISLRRSPGTFNPHHESGGRPHIPGPHNPYPGTGRHAGVPSLPSTDGHSGLNRSPGIFNPLPEPQSGSDGHTPTLGAHRRPDSPWFNAPVNPRGPHGPFGSQPPRTPLRLAPKYIPNGHSLPSHTSPGLATIDEHPKPEELRSGPSSSPPQPNHSLSTPRTTSTAFNRSSLPSSTGATGTPSIPSAPPSSLASLPSSTNATGSPSISSTPPSPHTSSSDSSDIFLKLLLATALLSHLHELNTLRRLTTTTPYREPDWDRIIAAWRRMLFSRECEVEILGKMVVFVGGFVRKGRGGEMG